MSDPWYSLMISENGKRISGTAALLQRLRLEGGMMEVLNQVAHSSAQNAVLTINEKFTLVPKSRSGNK